MTSYRIDPEHTITLGQAQQFAEELGFDDTVMAVGDEGDYPNDESWFADADSAEEILDAAQRCGIDATVCEY